MVCDGRIHPLCFLSYSSKPRSNSILYAMHLLYHLHFLYAFPNLLLCCVPANKVDFQLMVHGFPKEVVFQIGCRQTRWSF